MIGPEHDAVGRFSISEAAGEAHEKGFEKLFVVGFAYDSFALSAVPQIEASHSIKIYCITALADLLMGDLLKNTRACQVFAFCGMPDIKVLPSGEKHESGENMIQIKLLGLDIFDPATSKRNSLSGADVPMWMVDPDYDGVCFCPAQVFFPRTKAWELLTKKLRNEIDISSIKFLHSDTSTSFVPGSLVAVKAVDDRGNEFMAVVPPVPE